MSNVKTTKESFYKEIKRIYDECNEININIFNKHTRLKVDFQYTCLKYGGLKNICKELNINHTLYNEISKEEILRRAKECLMKNGRINKEICNKNQISGSTVKRHFGTYTELFKAIGYDNKFRRNVSKEDVLKDIREVSKKYNSTSSTVYRKNGMYSQTVIDRYGGWVVLLEELGLKPMNKKVGMETITKEVKAVIDEYGFISRKLIDDNCTFTYQALSAYFKNKKEISNYFGYDNIFNYGRSSKEKIIAKILSDEIGEGQYKTEFSWEWLKNTNGKRMYVDFYIPSKNLVLEYDGEQHFKFVSRFHKTKECFEKQVERDNLKNKLLEEHGIKVVRITYKDKITKDYICNLL